MRIPSTARNTMVVADTAVNALVGVLIVVGAARALGPQDLSDFALSQLVISTVLSIQRAGLLQPAMAVQRTTGRKYIPATWALTIGAPVGLITGVMLGLAIPSQPKHIMAWSITGMLVTGIVLAQDALRTSLMSIGRMQTILGADLFTLGAIVAGVLLDKIPNHPLGVLTYWGASVLIALLTCLSYNFYVRQRTPLPPRQTLSHAWSLGRWSTLDAGMSGVALLLPMFTAHLFIDPASAGIYRVLQTALGPLNILHMSILTIYSLEADSTRSSPGLVKFRSKVRNLTISMGSLSFIYVIFGEGLIIWITGSTGDDLFRIAVIVCLVGVLGALTTPVNAAALALGYHKNGAVIRACTLVASILVSTLAALGHWIPWSDPIGTTMLCAQTVALVGWTISYRRALPRELRAASPPHES